MVLYPSFFFFLYPIYPLKSIQLPNLLEMLLADILCSNQGLNLATQPWAGNACVSYQLLKQANRFLCLFHRDAGRICDLYSSLDLEWKLYKSDIQIHTAKVKLPITSPLCQILLVGEFGLLNIPHVINFEGYIYTLLTILAAKKKFSCKMGPLVAGRNHC